MKKVNLIIVLILVTAIGITIAGSRFGFEFGSMSYFFNSDKGKVYQLTEDFLEDIQFKDFKKAATYHTPEDQKEADIPKLIEEKFKIKPELMDIREIEIQRVEIDRSGDRARAHTMVHTKLLNSKEMRDIESIFFWHKKDGKWYMQLKSSL